MQGYDVDPGEKRYISPDLSGGYIELRADYVNKLLGVSFKIDEIEDLLARMRYGVVEVSESNTLKVSVPSYRTDILHPIDIVEDIAISYGYDNFTPQKISLYTVGEKDEREIFSDSARELLVGAGFYEVMTLIMTSCDVLFDMMCVPCDDVVETINPVSSEHGVVRDWLLPSLIEILKENKNREYPQKIFEAGLCVTCEGRDFLKISGVVADSRTNFSEIKAIVTGFLDCLNITYEVAEYEHGSFIPGRCASILKDKSEIGFFGEISPQVISNFSLEMPLTAFEINGEFLFEGKFIVKDIIN